MLSLSQSLRILAGALSEIGASASPEVIALSHELCQGSKREAGLARYPHVDESSGMGRVMCHFKVKMTAHRQRFLLRFHSGFH